MKKFGLIIIAAVGVIASVAYLWSDGGVSHTGSYPAAPVSSAVAASAKEAPPKEKAKEPKEVPGKSPTAEPKKESAQPPVKPAPIESRTPEEASSRAADPKDPSGALIIAPPPPPKTK